MTEQETIPAYLRWQHGEIEHRTEATGKGKPTKEQRLGGHGVWRISTYISFGE